MLGCRLSSSKINMISSISTSSISNAKCRSIHILGFRKACSPQPISLPPHHQQPHSKHTDSIKSLSALQPCPCQLVTSQRIFRMTRDSDANCHSSIQDAKNRFRHWMEEERKNSEDVSPPRPKSRAMRCEALVCSIRKAILYFLLTPR
jgi:hypothetical protein